MGIFSGLHIAGPLRVCCCSDLSFMLGSLYFSSYVLPISVVATPLLFWSPYYLGIYIENAPAIYPQMLLLFIHFLFSFLPFSIFIFS